MAESSIEISRPEPTDPPPDPRATAVLKVRGGTWKSIAAGAVFALLDLADAIRAVPRKDNDR